MKYLTSLVRHSLRNISQINFIVNNSFNKFSSYRFPLIESDRFDQSLAAAAFKRSGVDKILAYFFTVTAVSRRNHR